MNDMSNEPLSVVVEREIPHPPEKIWRALTQPHLIEEWLMKNDFRPEQGHRFNLSADWGGVEGEVHQVEPDRTLSYSWDTKDLRSVVTWTLSPTGTGTLLRMEQTGFQPDQQPYYRGAQAGWRLIHRGVHLTLHAEKLRARLVLTHPPHLYNSLAHESAAWGFRAVVEAAHGREVHSELEQSMPTGASVLVAWA